MKILINYANPKFEKARRLNSWTGRHIAHFDKVCEFRPDDVDEDFRRAHADIFAYERGNGLWLWKPYFINKVVAQCNDGDYIFYLDSGALFMRNPAPLYEYVTDDNPIFVTDIPLIESCWTKPSCFDTMDAHAFKGTNQIQATFILFKVNDYTRAFFREYLDLCSNTDMLIPDGLGKYDKVEKHYGNDFVSHREDQSVLSLLCKKKGIKAHRDISQRGLKPQTFYNPHYAYRVPAHPDDTYKPVVYLHKCTSLPAFLYFKLAKSVYNILHPTPPCPVHCGSAAVSPKP